MKPQTIIFSIAILFISSQLKAQSDFIKMDSHRYVNFSHTLALAIRGDKYTFMFYDKDNNGEYTFKVDDNIRKMVSDYLIKHKNWVKAEPNSGTQGSFINITGELYVNLDFVENITKAKDGNSWILNMSLRNTPVLVKVANEKGLLEYLGQ